MEKLFFLFFILVGCQKSEFTEGKFFAGGVYADKDTLELGKLTYQEYCFACHGMKGDGKGVAALGLIPPVRDFKTGVYKFGLSPDGAIPSDKQLVKIIREGLNGTAMLPWDISDKRLNAVIQYIKTFAPKEWEGKDKELPKEITLVDDPFTIAHKQTAIEKGKEVYHFQASCYTCHRGYVSLFEYNKMAKKLGEDTVESLDSDFYKLKAQASDYGSNVVPPDYTWHEVKSANNLKDLAYRIGAGVWGVMPAWKDVITDEEIWALAYYVQYLQKYKRDPKRTAFMKEMQP